MAQPGPVLSVSGSSLWGSERHSQRLGPELRALASCHPPGCLELEVREGVGHLKLTQLRALNWGAVGLPESQKARPLGRASGAQA